MERIAFLFAIACVFAGCSTDLDINAPYKNVTVVYGLLDQRQEVQYVKINKAYLGEGDALVYAQIADSNEWADGDITVARVHRVLNGTRVGTFDLTANLECSMHRTRNCTSSWTIPPMIQLSQVRK